MRWSNSGIEERAKRVTKGKGIDLRGKKIVLRQYSFPYDFVPDGQLSLEIHTWGGGLKEKMD